MPQPDATEGAGSPADPVDGPSRRRVLAGAALAAGAAVTLGACASSSSGGSGPGGPASPTGSAPAQSPSAADSASSGGSTGLVALSAVPVGGSVAATAPSGGPAIVAQPTAGTVVAFSAVCTHRGCTVAPKGKELDCPCHGSKYDAFTGQVINGPAPRPLAAIPVKVQGGQVVAT